MIFGVIAVDDAKEFNVILGPFVTRVTAATPTTNDRPNGSATPVPTAPRPRRVVGQFSVLGKRADHPQ